MGLEVAIGVGGGGGGGGGWKGKKGKRFPVWATGVSEGRVGMCGSVVAMEN